MYKVTEIVIQNLTLDELHKVKQAIFNLRELSIWEIDVDVTRLVNELILKKESTRG